VFIELHAPRSAHAVDTARGLGYTDVEVHKDLAGLPRVLEAHR
jgi:hypothetical protein